MKERKLDIDTKKHTVYSKRAKKAVMKRLEEEYGPEDAAILWESVQKKYVEYLKDCPVYGGRKNSHKLSIYDSILMFAWYGTVPHRPSRHEMRKLADEMFVSVSKKLGKVLDLSRTADFRLAARIFRKQVSDDTKCLEKYDGFVMVGDVFDPENGIVAYHYEKCPIAEFAKEHGFEEVMPALCNSDYLMLKEMNAGLIRRSTCMHSGRCDYCIVKRNDPLLSVYITDEDENGFLISRETGEKKQDA